MEGESWNKTMAVHLMELQPDHPIEGVEAILEAAGELKAYRLKVLLARLFEVHESNRYGGNEFQDIKEDLRNAITKEII